MNAMVIKFLATVKKLAIFFDESVKPDTSSITISQSLLVYSPKLFLYKFKLNESVSFNFSVCDLDLICFNKSSKLCLSFG